MLDQSHACLFTFARLQVASISSVNVLVWKCVPDAIPTPMQEEPVSLDRSRITSRKTDGASNVTSICCMYKTAPGTNISHKLRTCNLARRDRGVRGGDARHTVGEHGRAVPSTVSLRQDPRFHRCAI